MLNAVLASYGLTGPGVQVQSFGTGLINNTWKVIAPEGEYILQRINEVVFKKPENIAHNISKIAAYLEEHYPDYRFVAPVATVNGEQMVHVKEGYFRLFPFVPASHSKDVLETPSQAFEAAVQFGRFTKLLAGIRMSEIRTTIPDFHNLALRYRQFTESLLKGNKQRIDECTDLLNLLQLHIGIVNEYEHIIASSSFRLRIAHHDTKISNVLFDENGAGICVIDLDTMMPGYFISDVGDMMRTYLSPASEEESDFSKIHIREDFYNAIVDGYYGEMKEELTEDEKQHFFYAGKFMIYMQALRFITDYFNDDAYYGAKYPGHNLVRAKNQVVLLERLLEKEQVFSKITG